MRPRTTVTRTSVWWRANFRELASVALYIGCAGSYMASTLLPAVCSALNAGQPDEMVADVGPYWQFANGTLERLPSWHQAMLCDPFSPPAGWLRQVLPSPLVPSAAGLMVSTSLKVLAYQEAAVDRSLQGHASVVE